MLTAKVNLTRVPLTVLPAALQLALEVFRGVESFTTSTSRAYLSVKPSELLICKAEDLTSQDYWTHSEKNKEFGIQDKFTSSLAILDFKDGFYVDIRKIHSQTLLQSEITHWGKAIWQSVKKN